MAAPIAAMPCQASTEPLLEAASRRLGQHADQFSVEGWSSEHWSPLLHGVVRSKRRCGR